MALKEQDVVLYSTDADGNKVIQMPITRVENVEGAIKTINGVGADDTGNYSLNVGVTSINGKTGVVAIDTGIGRGIGRGGANINFSVASYNTYTVPSSGIITITCSCDSEGVDVYSDGVKLATEPYTDSWSEDVGGDTSQNVYYYLATFSMPVNANEVIGIVKRDEDYNMLWNGRYDKRLPFDGLLMQLKVI